LIGFVVVVVLIAGVVLAVRLFRHRHAAQRAAHDARLRAMAQASLAAMRKKQAAEKAQPAAPPPVREERDCPFCAEPILKKARVCKHCGRDVEPLA